MKSVSKPTLHKYQMQRLTNKFVLVDTREQTNSAQIISGSAIQKGALDGPGFCGGA